MIKSIKLNDHRLSGIKSDYNKSSGQWHSSFARAHILQVWMNSFTNFHIYCHKKSLEINSMVLLTTKLFYKHKVMMEVHVIMLALMKRKEIPCGKLKFQIFHSGKCPHCHFCDVNVVSSPLWKQLSSRLLHIFPRNLLLIGLWFSIKIKGNCFGFKNVDFCWLKTMFPYFKFRYE